METDQLKLSTKWQGDFVFEAAGQGGHILKMDAHKGVGKEQGLLPMQALLGSLAGCVGMDVVMILRAKMGDVRSIEIVTEGDKRREPPKEFFGDYGHVFGRRRYRRGQSASRHQSERREILPGRPFLKGRGCLPAGPERQRSWR
ncbi:MAG: OsmC family protein [Bacillota bacterium]